jgi:hypothetical protein
MDGQWELETWALDRIVGGLHSRNEPLVVPEGFPQRTE